MNFTIPSTKYTKAICFTAGKTKSCGYGFVIAFVSVEKKATKGDDCIFWNTKYGFSYYELQCDHK